MLALFFASCEKEYDAPTGEPNHNMIESSLKNTGNVMQVNGSFYLYDFSRGVESRTWELTADATDLEGNELLSSSDQRIDVIFTEPGEKIVKLYHVFGDTVYSNGGFKDTHLDTTNIIITVLDSLKANFRAERVLDNTALTNSDNALNKVQAGREVLYTDASIGQPSEMKWIFTREDGVTASFDGKDGMVTAKLSSAGIYDITMVASSNYGKDTLTYSKYIEIIPSTDPMVIESVTADSKIYIQYGRDVFDPSDCPVNAFTLKVTNEGKEYPVEVSSIALNTDPSIIELTVDALIYSTDEILISYDDVIGTLKSSDDMKITSFTDVSIDKFNNLIDIFEKIGLDGGLENSVNTNLKNVGWMGADWQKYNMDENVSSVMAYEGRNSLYLEQEVGGGACFLYHDNVGTAINAIPLEADKVYVVSMWIYIEQLDTSIDSKFAFLNTGNWADWWGAYFSTDTPIGVWHQYSHRFKSANTEEIPFMFQGNNPGSQVSKIYIDNIKLEELESRP